MLRRTNKLIYNLVSNGLGDRTRAFECTGRPEAILYRPTPSQTENLGDRAGTVTFSTILYMYSLYVSNVFKHSRTKVFLIDGLTKNVLT